ncbi:lytic transglycosylase domain-containing protein [Gordonia sp. TBRC 11910]|uniref:Lytic transglycosylase domain-containing protein n=1 Tax=Gordonia asplenii TaxID=2725283 RepID=A0A848KT34_9ACTN|nr:lytic transglycosylase domain-containing protein [Gordonia asplenii]NMO01157.1 lytic transglycosylase domain-containing protein [Gordonia asplenii]
MSRLRFWQRADGPSPSSSARRAVATGVGGALIAAIVMGAATSSAHSDDAAPVLTGAPVAAPAVVGVVPASGSVQAMNNFAPPAPLPASLIAPQFRLAADLPSGPLGIPGVVLQAYKLAASRLADEEPICKLPWFLLAGIGRIESNHAGNGNVDSYGNTLTPINGPALDGTLAGNEVILDHSGQAVRAMGPMQFIPSTWAKWGSDANGDGKADPNNIFDATYSAGRYLCSGMADIMAGNNEVTAVLRYNHSMEYVTNVLGWAAAYATGVMPTNPPKDPRRAASTTTTAKTTPSTSGTPTTPTTKPTTQPRQNCFIVCLPGFPVPAPQPKPSPKPAPKPTAPKSPVPVPQAR